MQEGIRRVPRPIPIALILLMLLVATTRIVIVIAGNAHRVVSLFLSILAGCIVVFPGEALLIGESVRRTSLVARLLMLLSR